ncbi:MAG: hypothetical protein FWG72_02365 [Oscillospiraceae bacterium]|nr:hypothetical protein [Oscillospiraceae bacterium]
MQKEKTNLTPKEKRLLATAAVLGLFYLAFQFGFLPLYNEFKEKTERLEELNGEWAVIGARLNEEERVRGEHLRAKTAYGDIENRFVRTDTTTDLSNMLIMLCRNNNLDIVSQGLGAPAAFSVPGGAAHSVSAFSTVTTTMSVSGGYDSVKRLLDTVDASNAVHVSRLSFSPAFDAETPDRVSVTFVVTLLNGID